MNKVLIANRGEIARRVIRTLKKMNIKSVAVYSEADKNAPFVLEADEAVLIGPAPSAQSYLVEDKIIQVAKDLNVDAIHPGYGFLAENSGFARRLKKENITLIGPSPEAMDLMGDKITAKQTVKEYGVPLVPGIDKEITDIAEAKEIAEKIGFPILVKASAGGGGKGMRLVEKMEDLEEQMKLAQSEARSSFGDDAVFIEKFVTQPRHIEIQIFADNHGNIIHLHERECSIQRRHQKVIEEAPSAIVTPELRAKMGEAACNVAKSCNYIGAGTVEFLLDADMNFYFLEMNTRIQVEHPITEEITGLDLIELQVRVARNEKLPIKQEDIQLNGHAMEVRVYAEDALNNFTPDIGTLNRYKKPSGEHIRIDDAFEEGMEIPIYYDPMIAKLVTWGENREESIERMIQAIDDFEISGLKTTLDFGKYVMKHEAFRSGNFDTNFVKHYFSDPEVLHEAQEEEKKALEASMDELWKGIVENKNKEFTSQKINS
ncbi:MAG TPA: acetyl-CoA carboxylase biotin carboxylase subunit [Brumimicrobium sp.]|nr:acetyl-CoA carboxylase biotin carboxylase subunit [Brumimicrobium sp.]